MFDFGRISAKGLGRAVLAFGLTLLAAGAALGQPQILIAGADPTLPNRFTVNFPPELGGPQTADIVSTDYILKIDADANFASIRSYYQLIDPIYLGEQSTGDITVRLGGKSLGTYHLSEPDMGVFVTKEIYKIFFEGDLRKYGLESPFTTPSTTEGTVTFTDASAGRIHMEWEGEGEIPNPRNPGEPFLFTYNCEANSVFRTGVPCDAVKNHRAGPCVEGKLRVVVAMRDDSRDGDVVVIDVAGEPQGLLIKGKKARKKFRRRSGQQVINLFTDETGCRRPRYVHCGE